MNLKLIIADDHKIVRDGLRLLIERQPGLQVVGEAADGRTAVGLMAALQPDLALLDLAMPELNGVEAARQMRSEGFRGGIVILSMHRERHFISKAYEAGVNGYVLKDHAFEQVLEAITLAAHGEKYISPQLAGITEGGNVLLVTQILTAREREILQMLAEGQSTKEVAHALHVSPKTVESHRLNLMAKLQVNNLADLTRLAVREGIASI